MNIVEMKENQDTFVTLLILSLKTQLLVCSMRVFTGGRHMGYLYITNCPLKKKNMMNE